MGNQEAMPPKEDAAETKKGGIDKQTVITVLVVIVLLAILLVCSFVSILRLPMCALQVLMIGIVSIKWEEDSWLATGPNRPARLCCQFWMILIPFWHFRLARHPDRPVGVGSKGSGRPAL